MDLGDHAEGIGAVVENLRAQYQVEDLTPERERFANSSDVQETLKDGVDRRVGSHPAGEERTVWLQTTAYIENCESSLGELFQPLCEYSRALPQDEKVWIDESGIQDLGAELGSLSLSLHPLRTGRAPKVVVPRTIQEEQARRIDVERE
jgi:hypothetical protein